MTAIHKTLLTALTLYAGTTFGHPSKAIYKCVSFNQRVHATVKEIQAFPADSIIQVTKYASPLEIEDSSLDGTLDSSAAQDNSEIIYQKTFYSSPVPTLSAYNKATLKFLNQQGSLEITAFPDFSNCTRVSCDSSAEALNINGQLNINNTDAISLNCIALDQKSNYEKYD